MKKTLIIIGTVLIAGAIGITMYLRTFNTLTIEFSDKSPGLIVDVYNSGPDTVNEAQQLTEKNLVASNISSKQKIRLKKGGYSVVSRKNDTYEPFNQKVSLYQGNTNSVVEPYFSESKLKTLLEPQKSAIQSAATSAYPRITGRYIFEDEKLFHFGDWYGATLKYVGTDRNNADSLLVVMKKEGTNWKIVTRPPSLIVSQKDYPDIPLDIANSLNLRAY
jgi:hypothetical protein